MFVQIWTSISRRLLPYAIGFLLLAGISSGLSFTSLSVLQSFRIIFGSVFLLLLPGYVWSFVFWKRNEIDFIERFALSLALSLALVPLVVYALNRIGIPITLWNSIMEISGLILVGALTIMVMNYFEKKKHEAIPS